MRRKSKADRQWDALRTLWAEIPKMTPEQTKAFEGELNQWNEVLRQLKADHAAEASECELLNANTKRVPGST